MQTERNPQFPETLSAFTPEGDKVEIFRNESTSPGFTPTGETADTFLAATHVRAVDYAYGVTITQLTGPRGTSIGSPDE